MIIKSFADFQATRIDTADLNTTLQEHGQDWWDEPNIAGCVYGDGFYIVGPTATGDYELTLDRQTFVSAAREKLERQLYDFAVLEGFFDDPDAPPADDDVVEVDTGGDDTPPTDRELVIAALEMLSSDDAPICAGRDDLLRRLRAGSVTLA